MDPKLPSTFRPRKWPTHFQGICFQGKSTTQGHRNHTIFVHEPSAQSVQFSNLPTFHNFSIGFVSCFGRLRNTPETWQFHVNTMDFWEGLSERVLFNFVKQQSKGHCDLAFFHCDEMMNIRSHLKGFFKLGDSDDSGDEHHICIYIQMIHGSDVPTYALLPVLTGPPFYALCTEPEIGFLCDIWIKFVSDHSATRALVDRVHHVRTNNYHG